MPLVGDFIVDSSLRLQPARRLASGCQGARDEGRRIRASIQGLHFSIRRDQVADRVSLGSTESTNYMYGDTRGWYAVIASIPLRPVKANCGDNTGDDRRIAH